MRRRTRKPEREGSLASLTDLLPVLYKQLELDEKVNEFAVLALWKGLVSELAGEALANQTKAVRVRNQNGKRTLYAIVANAALASELGFQVTGILGRLNQYQPQTGIHIDSIRLTVGSLS